MSPQILSTLSDHMVGCSVVFPGVGFVEIAFASMNLADPTALSAVGYLRPCLLPTSSSDLCVL